MSDIRNKKSQTAKKYKMTAPAQKAGESNYDYSQRLAKMADTRLRRLEKLSNEPNFGNVEKWAYSNAMADIKGLYGGGKTFQRRAGKTKAGAYNERQVQAQISAIKRFLESPTSTKGGIKKTFQSRADTLNEKYGTDFTWEDLGKFFESGLADKMDLKYGSKTKMRAIGVIQKNDLQTLEDIQKYREQTTLTNDQQVVLSKAEDLLREYGTDISKQFFN